MKILLIEILTNEKIRSEISDKGKRISLADASEFTPWDG